MTTHKANASAVISKARSQLGTSEQPPFSNRQPYGAWYGMNGVAWCAIFVSWVFWHAGYPLPPIRTRKGFAYCPDIVNWAKRNDCWVDRNTRPEPGWIVLFDFPGDGVNRPSHVGIVQGVLPDGRVHCLEGNTNGSGSRTGGKVMEHYRSVAGGIIGYVKVINTGKALTNTVVTSRTLKVGDSGPDVKYAQATLNRIRAKQRLPRIVEDGDFGPATEKAVKEFQKFARDMQVVAGVRDEKDLIDADGVVGPQTRSAAAFWSKMR